MEMEQNSFRVSYSVSSHTSPFLNQKTESFSSEEVVVISCSEEETMETRGAKVPGVTMTSGSAESAYTCRMIPSHSPSIRSSSFKKSTKYLPHGKDSSSNNVKVQNGLKYPIIRPIIRDREDETSSNMSTDEESTSSSDFLCKSSLKWTEKKTSRVGQEYQAAYIPEAGSNLKLEDDNLNQSEPFLLADQIWDPLAATRKGINDFVHLKCPFNKKEAALELLHKKGYNKASFEEELQRLPVLDGTDWSLAEHDNFRKLMQLTSHNIKSVSRSMGKSINNCLTVYYRIINVRETRSTNKRFDGTMKMEKVTGLKDIVRSRRIEQRNRKKVEFVASPLNDEEVEFSPSVQHNNSRKRSKAASALDNCKAKRLCKKKQSKANPESTFQEKVSIRTSPRTRKIAPIRFADEQATEEIYATLTKVKIERKQSKEDVGRKEQIQQKESTPAKGLRLRHIEDALESVEQDMKALVSLPKVTVRRRIPTSVANKSDNDNCDINEENRDGARSANTRMLLRHDLLQMTVKAPTSKDKINPSPLTNLNSEQNDMWQFRYKELIQFKEENGHCLVPKLYPENRTLSYWVFRQRGLYTNRNQKKEKNGLTDERIQMLKDIGFVFKARHSKEQYNVDSVRMKLQLDAKWLKFFNIFCKYKEETGSCHISKIYAENQALSSWAFTQRHQMKRRTDKKYSLLTDERVKKLNDLGFIWHAKKNKEWQMADRVRKQAQVEDVWQKHYKNLLQFMKKHGHTRVPKIYKQNQPLSAWVFRQRAHHRRMKEGDIHAINDERLELLEKIEFQFRVRK